MKFVPSAPRLMATCSSSWQKKPVTQARFALHRVADRHSLGRERLVVVVDPAPGFFGIEERERERSDAVLRGQLDRFSAGARDPDGGMGPLDRFRHNVARREADVFSDVTGERRLGQAAQRDADALFPHRTLVARVDPERVELGRRGSFARAELDAPAGQDVEGRDPLRDARRMVDRRQGVHDAVTEPDALRALRCRGEEELRCARMRVLLEEVMLDEPCAVDADPVGELDLFERLGEDARFVAVFPRARHLMLEEQPESHDSSARRPAGGV